MKKHRQHKTLCRHDWIVSFERQIEAGRTAINERCTLCDARQNRVISKEELDEVRRKRRCFDDEMMTFG
ncbi:hypothetical protein KAR91_47550 [Candidatus Pacearchaeota archaeon]|nr:hypothetical protein [Candidatus Pacearchaeota archaeon]